MEKKDCILSLRTKGGLGISKNCRAITLTAIVSKVYNALFLNRIKAEIKKIDRKKQNDFGEIDPEPHRIWLSIESLKEYLQKASRQHDYSQISLRHMILYAEGR